jgi:protein AIR1/2
LWRLYDYMTDDEKSDSIRVREEKSKLSLGQGGEGYIAGDEWCYNCAGSGHWGDVSSPTLFLINDSDDLEIQDCNDLPHRADHPREPSAFSSYNILSGPFFDPTAKPTPKTFRRRQPRDWEQANDLPEGWGNHTPENIGKQGRRKNIAKMERRERQQAVDDDPDDWFGNPRNARARSTMSVLSQHSGGSGKEPPTGPKKLTFGSSLKDAEQRFRSRPFTTTSLLDRLGGDDDRSSSRGQYNERRSDHNSSWGTSRSKHDLGNDAHDKQRDGYEREGDRNRHRPRDEPGPRYKGGYRR